MRGLSGFVLVFSSSSILREFLIYQWQRRHKKTIILSEKGSLFPSENEIEGVRKRKFADLARVLYESDEFIMTVTPDSFFSPFPSRNEWEKRKIRLQKGELNLERFLVFLSETGYERVSIVRERGEFARRGFIIDIFPSGTDLPVRIETDGNEISSLKRFNPVNQVVMDEIDAIEIFPAEIEGDSKFADEIPQGSSIIVQSAFILNDRIIDWIISKRYPTLLLSEKGVINEKILKSADEILEPEPFEFDPLSFLRSKANPLYALSLWTKDKIYRGMDVFFSYTTESGFKRA
jgi:hypothetical protein